MLVPAGICMWPDLWPGYGLHWLAGCVVATVDENGLSMCARWTARGIGCRLPLLTTIHRTCISSFPVTPLSASIADQH